MKNALVIGAGRNLGIGAEICRMLAKNGINVYFTSDMHYDESLIKISNHDYKKTLTDCKNYDVKVYFKAYDLRLKSNISKLFDEAENKLGNIDIIINSSCYHTLDNIDSLNDELLDLNFAINAKLPLLLSQEFYKRFKGSNGRIIHMSSTQSLEPLTTEISYAISKAAIPVIVSTLAPIVAKKKITINAINPGFTDINENLDIDKSNNLFGRNGTPADVSHLVEFLVSDKGSWITGQTINSEGCIVRKS